MTPTVLVTRPAARSQGLVELLRQRGVESLEVPTVALDPSSAAVDLDRMLATLDGSEWLILTSVNGAEALVARIAVAGLPIPAGTRVAAVGPATADALRAAGVRVDHVPSRYLTVEIASGLGDVHGRRVVLARADAATAGLRHALLDRGALVDEVIAYRTLEGPPTSRDALRVALHADIDGITFTSSSTVRGLLRLASAVDRGRARALPSFCIGPITAETARRSGFNVAAVAVEHTAAGLASIIATHFDRGDR